MTWPNPCSLKINEMKKGIHPDSYRFVVFKDMSNGTTFLTRSAAHSKEMINGKTVTNTL
jgi:ribosomal protein L31